MASGDSDHIEIMETSVLKKNDNLPGPTVSEDDDRADTASIAEKNVPYDPAVGPLGAMGKVHKSDRKIGHRRVGEGGEITYKKIQSSQIMGSIQLGIQHAIGGLASKPERDLLMQDFMTVETTNFPHEGSNHTPAHHYSEFKFKTYAPIAFRYFRDLFGIQPDDFLMSMCSAPLRELSNPGASGSIFYLTNDDEFIIKTVQHKEGEFLQKLLPGYYLNLDQNPRTLLPKFFGLYCYQCNSKNVRLVAMNNLLPSSVKLHQKYDLKGSTYKRKASKSERQKRSPTYKDLDFMEHHTEGIFLEADTYNALIKTMQRDCRVLESFKIMDYSLLVGIHNLDEAQREKSEARNRTDSAGASDGDDAEGEPKKSGLNRTRSEQGKEDFGTQVKRTQSINRQRLVAHSTAMESIQAESEPIDEEDDVPPGGIPARNARGERLLLFLGIIDILQSYRLRKKLEHTWKSMIHDGDTVSVHRPSFYAQRFHEFMSKTVFKKIPSSLKHSPSKRKSIAKPARAQDEVETPGAGSSGVASVKAVSLSDVTAHITPTSVTSPVSSAAKVTDTTSMTPATVEPEVAFPAVLKGSQKQRVPPPVPPRGSPKTKRGGCNSQPSLETKGDYQILNISVSDIPPQTPITSSDDDILFYGHDFKLQEHVACSLPISVSNLSISVTKLVDSNPFLSFVEDGDNFTQRSHLGKTFFAQTSMINLDEIVREHLDSGDYEDTSFTESSSEEKIVLTELIDTGTAKTEIKEIQSEVPSKMIINASSITDTASTNTFLVPLTKEEKMSLHNIKPSDLISAAKTLKKVPKSDNVFSIHNKKMVKCCQLDQKLEMKEKKDKKSDIIPDVTKKLNVAKREKTQEKKLTPKVEIRTYSECRSKGGMTKDEVVCHKKAKTKIDMFQKQILKAQSDSECSSRRSSISSSQNSKKSSNDFENVAKETKNASGTKKVIHDKPSSVDNKHFWTSTTIIKPKVSHSINNINEKIKQFSENIVMATPTKIPRNKKKSSLKRKIDKKKVYVVKKDLEEIL